MNDDRACEIIRLLDSIDTTLREVNKKLDGLNEAAVEYQATACAGPISNMSITDIGIITEIDPVTGQVRHV